MSLKEGFGVGFRWVVRGGFSVENEGKRGQGWGERNGDRQRNRQVNAHVLVKTYLSPRTKLGVFGSLFMPTKFLVLVGAGICFIFEGGSANCIFMGVGIFLNFKGQKRTPKPNKIARTAPNRFLNKSWALPAVTKSSAKILSHKFFEAPFLFGLFGPVHLPTVPRPLLNEAPHGVCH